MGDQAIQLSEITDTLQQQRGKNTVEQPNPQNPKRELIFNALKYADFYEADDDDAQEILRDIEEAQANGTLSVPELLKHNAASPD